MGHISNHEKLPSGKVVIRYFDKDGNLVDEQQSYGILDIGIKYDFAEGVKVAETYFAKRRLVSRRTYEKARSAYPDMPPSDPAVEDWGADLLRGVRKQERQNKCDAERRLAQSDESRFPRPSSTNWLRVISGEKSHLVLFASRDWKVLSRERSISSGREWLHVFGFDGTLGVPGDSGSVAKGLEVGYEVPGNRDVMLDVSRRLLTEVMEFAANPPEVSRWSGSVRPRRRPRPTPPLAWPTVIPPLIEFLSALPEPNLAIFNHHR